MSTTATESRTQEELLHDYDIYLTTSVPPVHELRTSFPNCPPSRDAPRPEAENPPNWTNDWRQVPPYRPANRGLDLDMRPLGSNRLEQAFILHMFEGVALQATGSWIWRSTIGRFNESLWRFKIGGEI